MFVFFNKMGVKLFLPVTLVFTSLIKFEINLSFSYGKCSVSTLLEPDTVQ